MNNRSLNGSEITIQIIVSLLTLLFVYAASSKLLNYTEFRVELGKSPLITSFAGIVAWSIPTLEIITALSLAFSGLRLLGLYAAFSLLTIFSAYILYILLYSPYIPCSCGGVLQRMSWRGHFLFNIGFMIVAAWGVLIHRGGKKGA